MELKYLWEDAPTVWELSTTMSRPPRNTGKELCTARFEAGESSSFPQLRPFYRMSQNEARERPMYHGFPQAFNSNDIIDEVIRIARTWAYEEVTWNFSEYLNRVSVVF